MGLWAISTFVGDLGCGKPWAKWIGDWGLETARSTLPTSSSEEPQLHEHSASPATSSSTAAAPAPKAATYIGKPATSLPASPFFDAPSAVGAGAAGDGGAVGTNVTTSSAAVASASATT